MSVTVVFVVAENPLCLSSAKASWEIAPFEAFDISVSFLA